MIESYFVLATEPTVTAIKEREYMLLTNGINLNTTDMNLPMRRDMNLPLSFCLVNCNIFCPIADSTHTVPNIERKSITPNIKNAKGAPTSVNTKRKSGNGIAKSITIPTA